MGEVTWAPSALDDIDAIAEYIARDSVDRAALFVTRVFEMTDRLQEFPRSGRVIPEIGDQSCREILYEAYRIMYRIHDDEVMHSLIDPSRRIKYESQIFSRH